MKNSKKLAVAMSSFAIASITLVGGAYAWYVITNTATATVNGTTITAEQMDVGIKSTTLTTLENYRYDADKQVLWPTSTNAINAETTVLAAEALRSVYTADGYALDNEIAPVTAGSFDETGELKLYERVSDLVINPVGSDVAANTQDYIRYTLAFQTTGGNKDVYLDEAMMNFSGDADVLSSLRIGFSTTEGDRIFDPTIISADANNDLKVGGILDLDGDNAYDYRDISVAASNSYEYREVYYGEYNGEVTYEEVTEDLAVPVPGSNFNSFVAKHVTNAYAGYPSTTYTAVAEAKTQTVRGLKYFTSTEDEDGNVLGHKLVTTDADGYGEVTVTIWLEGWDLDCSILFAGETFSATIGFLSPYQDLVRA